MKTDSNLDRQLRSILREELDREIGPDRTWAESPAAKRVTELNRRVRRRWPLRLLAAAALIGAGSGAALLGGGLNPHPRPGLPAANGPIAFTVSQAGDTDIWFTALGQEARRVVGSDTDQVRQECPAFSPDGRSLAYGRVEGHGPQYDVGGLIQSADYSRAALVVADVSPDGQVSGRQTVDIGDGVPAPCPVWSPGGERVAFAVNLTSPTNPLTSGEGSQIWIVTLTDGSIATLPDLLATDLEWSPDGSLLAVVGGVEAVSDGPSDARIHLYELSSGRMRTLDNTLGADRLTWSPDGGRIAYTTSRQSSELRIMDVETEEQRVVIDHFVGALHGIGLVWSPDGKTILYQRGTEGEHSDVVLLTPGDPPSEVVVPLVLAGGNIDGSDLTLSPYRVTWSPDGAYLLGIGWGPSADGEEPTLLIAVPIDPDLRAVKLYESTSGNNLVSHDGYDTTFVHTQVWGRLPSG